MKFTGKYMAAACLLAAIGAGAYLVRTNVKASTSQTTYVFTNSGIVFGADPSPLQIVQVSDGGKALPIGKAIAGTADLLDGVQVRLRNSSPQEIKFAQLRVDVIDPQTSRIVTTAAGLTLDANLAIGQEQTGKVMVPASASLRQSLSNSGQVFQQVIVQVDFVVMSNGTSWKYGLLHRQDPKDPNSWVPISASRRQISLNRAPQNGTGKAVFEKISMRPSKPFVVCRSFGGYSLNPRADCPYCNVYDERWPLDPNNGFAEAGNVVWHCADGHDCTKYGYIGYVENCDHS